MNKKSIYEQRKRDRLRLLKIKKAHEEYNKKISPILNQLKENENQKAKKAEDKK